MYAAFTDLRERERKKEVESGNGRRLRRDDRRARRKISRRFPEQKGGGQNLRSRNVGRKREARAVLRIEGYLRDTRVRVRILRGRGISKRSRGGGGGGENTVGRGNVSRSTGARVYVCLRACEMRSLLVTSLRFYVVAGETRARAALVRD